MTPLPAKRRKSYLTPRKNTSKRRKGHNWYIQLLLAITLLIALLLLSTLLSRVLSPAEWVWLAYPMLVFPFLVAANLIFLAYWGVKLSKIALIPLFALLVNIQGIYTYCPWHWSDSSIPSQSIKVLSFNTQMFNTLRKHTKDNPNTVLSYIRDSHADIVCLQEFGYSEYEQHLQLKSILKELRPLYPYHRINMTDKDHWHTYGTAIFSKYPIESQKQIPYASLYNSSHAYILNIDGTKVKIINNHLESNKLTSQDKELYRDALKELNSNQLNKVAENLTYKLSVAYQIRAQQTDLVRAEINSTASDIPVIVCGDFNDTPLSYTYHQISKDLIDSFVECRSGLGVTFKPRLFPFRIDFILHSNHFTSHRFEVDHSCADSDHYPVWALLTLKKPK